jgi:hypothetical protein
MTAVQHADVAAAAAAAAAATACVWLGGCETKGYDLSKFPYKQKIGFDKLNSFL